ncbi:MAG TPA: hypothetical protein VFX07_06540 [Candidatus Udaeobacter sp.]|nr:hypothetical protein [Candidatus Udaeobacter sp.]
MKTLANRIEDELQHGLWSHCAIYEDELQRLWPLDAPYREVRIAAFAAKYGFRLRFYHKGMCAIFDRQPDEEAASAIKGPQRAVFS